MIYRVGSAPVPFLTLILLVTLLLPLVALGQGMPDLTVETVNTTAATGDWQELTIAGTVSVTLANVGTAPTEQPAMVTVFADVDRDGVLGGTDTILGSVQVGALGAGGITVALCPVSGPVQFRGSPIYALVDSASAIAEYDETNNYSNSGLSCEYDSPPGAFSPVLEWSWTSSAVQPAALNVMMTPSVIDLNGDAVPDLVFASTASTGGGSVEVGYLRALRGDSGTEAFTVNDPSYLINTASSVATGDIDGDMRPEIVACDATGHRLIAFEHDGSYKWRSPDLEPINWGAPAVADLDGDGSPEIVIGRQVLNHDGTLLWTGAGGRGNQGIGPLSVVADIDLDGSPEVVAGNTVYRADGSILSRNSSLPDGLNAVANFDADDYPEIVLVSGGSVRLLEHTGSVKWGPVGIPGGGGGPPTVADFDGDSEVEIGVAGAARYVVFETDGSVLWQAVTQDSSSNVTGSSVFDFEGDGLAEVVYRDELKLRVYRGTDGAVLFETPMSSCTWHEYVLVADVDADGNSEIVAVANNNCGFGQQRGIYVYGDSLDSWVPTRALWNQHSYHITNINDDGTIPQAEQNNWQTYNNYRQNQLPDAPPAAAPDVTASFLRMACAADGVSLTIRIGNGGAVLVPAGVAISFVIGDPSSGGTLLGSATTSSALQPGQFEDVVLRLPPGMSPLDAIYVLADSAGAHNECNENNNTHVVAHLDCDYPPDCCHITHPDIQPVVSADPSDGPDPITASPGVLCIVPGERWAGYVKAAQCDVPYTLKNVVLTKKTPEIVQCADVFPVKTVSQQGSQSIRLWWPLMYETAGTTWTLNILYGTSEPWDDDGAGPNPAGYVHTDEWKWLLEADIPHMKLILSLFHELPLGTCEVPLVSDEALYVTLQQKLTDLATLVDDEKFTEAGLLLGDFEMEVMDACILSCPRTPRPTGPGTGIANTLDNPACCKLMADAEYVGKSLGIFQPTK